MSLHSDLARAQRRVRAARELLDWVRSGGAMADLIDPATGEPIPVSQAARAMKAKAQAASQQPAPSPSPAEAEAEAQAPAQTEAQAPAQAQPIQDPESKVPNPEFARVLEILARRDPPGTSRTEQDNPRRNADGRRDNHQESLPFNQKSYHILIYFTRSAWECPPGRSAASPRRN